MNLRARWRALVRRHNVWAQRMSDHARRCQAADDQPLPEPMRILGFWALWMLLVTGANATYVFVLAMVLISPSRRRSSSPAPRPPEPSPPAFNAPPRVR